MTSIVGSFYCEISACFCDRSSGYFWWAWEPVARPAQSHDGAV